MASIYRGSHACEAAAAICEGCRKSLFTLLSVIPVQAWSRRAGLTMNLRRLRQVGFHTISPPPAAQIRQKKTSPQRLHSRDGGWLRSRTPGAAHAALTSDVLLLCTHKYRQSWLMMHNERCSHAGRQWQQLQPPVGRRRPGTDRTVHELPS